jgi:hypothetical protein
MEQQKLSIHIKKSKESKLVIYDNFMNTMHGMGLLGLVNFAFQ